MADLLAELEQRQPVDLLSEIDDPRQAQPQPITPGQVALQTFGFDPVSLAQTAKGALEAVTFLGTSAIARPVAGLEALSVTAIEGAEAGAEQVREAQERFTFQPGEQGQKVLQTIGEGLQSLLKIPGIDKIIEGAKSTSELITKIGETVGPVIADPLATISGQETEQAEFGRRVGGALGRAVPEALIEGLALRGAIPATQAARQFGRAPRVSPEIKTAISDVVQPVTESIKKGVATDDILNPIAEIIKKGTPDELAALIDADPDFFRAADELGITTEPLASFASRNPQFIAVESGLASVPSSILDVQTKAFIGELAKKADDLIEQYGGTLDKGQLNIDFKRNALVTIEDLAQQADDVYGSIAKILPKSERHASPETIGFIESISTELGGVKELPRRLKSILNNLKSKIISTKGKRIVDPATGKVTFSGATTETINPTLGKIDQTRREIGQALNKKSGPFKDTEQGLLKALYARLTKDQDAIAESAGFGDITDSAKALVRQQKQLEDNLAVLLGTDLNQALSVNVAGAIKGLAKNEIGRFNKVINAIPEAQRGGVILSAMNDVFRGSGVGQQSLSPTQFVKWFQNIERSPAVKKKLFENLPKGSPKAIQNLFKVSSGISRALGDRVETGRLNAMFNEDTGFIRRMIGRVAPLVIAGATGSPVASFMTNATLEFLNQSTSGAKRASDLLGSPQFQAIIRRSVKEGVIEGNKVASSGLQKAETALTNTKPYKEWVKTLSPEQQQNLQSSGLIGYLFINELEEQ